MLISYLFAALCSFFLGLLLVAILRKLAVRFNMLVKKDIPLIGGIAIGLSFVIISLAVFSFSRGLSHSMKGIIIASFIMLVFGVIDDWKELSIPAKLCAQIIATYILVRFGVRTHIIYIGNLANIIITFLWVLGITNAFNHLDVIDGIAAGIALIVSLSFFTVSFFNGDVSAAVLTLILGAAVLSFLIYNLPPAKIYMGNSGSHFLGFILAAVALVISYAPMERKMALFSPILILGFPIFDTAFLIFIRMSRGRSALKKSDDHIALRFLRLGYSKNKTLIFMFAITLFFSLCGIITSRVSNLFTAVIIVFVALLSLILTKKMCSVSA